MLAHAGLTSSRRGLEPGCAARLPQGAGRVLAYRLRLASAEARLNGFPQFTTEIDGQTIHFLHVRSPEPDALPLVITHGYPSSIAEFVTDRSAHQSSYPRRRPGRRFPRGGAFAARVRVLQPARGRMGIQPYGQGLGRVMRRLGYERYGAHGGDIGAGVSGTSGSTTPTTSSARTSAPIRRRSPSLACCPLRSRA